MNYLKRECKLLLSNRTIAIICLIVFSLSILMTYDAYALVPPTGDLSDLPSQLIDDFSSYENYDYLFVGYWDLTDDIYYIAYSNSPMQLQAGSEDTIECIDSSKVNYKKYFVSGSITTGSQYNISYDKYYYSKNIYREFTSSYLEDFDIGIGSPVNITTNLDTGDSYKFEGPVDLVFDPYGTVEYTYLELRDGDRIPHYGTESTSTGWSISLDEGESYSIEVLSGAIDVTYLNSYTPISDNDISGDLPVVELTEVGEYITVTNNTASQQEFYIQSKADYPAGPGSWIYYNLDGDSGYMSIDATGDDWETLYLSPGQSIYLELSEAAFSFSSLRIDLNDLSGSEIKFSVTEEFELYNTEITKNISNMNTWRIQNYTGTTQTITVDTSEITSWMADNNQVYFIPLKYKATTNSYFVDEDLLPIIIEKGTIQEVTIPNAYSYDMQIANVNDYSITYLIHTGFEVNDLGQQLYSTSDLYMTGETGQVSMEGYDVTVDMGLTDEMVTDFEMSEAIQDLKELRNMAVQPAYLIKEFMYGMPQPVGYIFSTVLITVLALFGIKIALIVLT